MLIVLLMINDDHDDDNDDDDHDDQYLSAISWYSRFAPCATSRLAIFLPESLINDHHDHDYNDYHDDYHQGLLHGLRVGLLSSYQSPLSSW